MTEIQENGNNDQMVKYDLLVILSPLLPEEKVAEEMGKITKIVESRRGNVFETEMPKLRPLSYPVSKTWEGKKSIFDQGQFGWLKLEVGSTEVPAIKDELAGMQYLLRFAITYAYLDVRPVRRIPVNGDSVNEEPVVSSLPPELVNVPPAEPEKATGTDDQQAPAKEESLPRKVMSEAEIDKQIEDLLS